MTWKNDRYQHGLCAKGIKTSHKGVINPKFKKKYVIWINGDFTKEFDTYFESLLYVHSEITEKGKWGNFLITEQISDSSTNEFIREKVLAKIKNGEIDVER